jgi:hypothetical protein
MTEGRDKHGGGDHQSIDHLVYTVGSGCLIAAIVNFVVVWPEHHLLALLVFAALLSAPLIAELHKRGVENHVIGGIVFWLFTAAFVSSAFFPDLAAETDIHGWLIPARDPSAKTACPDRPWSLTANVEDQTKQLTLALGTTGMQIPYIRATPDATSKDIADAKNENERQRTALQIGTCKALAVRRTSAGISVDADIASPSGDIIAEIRDNEFHLVPSQIAFPRRPDRSTLTLIGRKGEELLWIRYLNPRSMKVRGLFSCAGHGTIRVADDVISVPPERIIARSCFMLREMGIVWK